MKRLILITIPVMMLFACKKKSIVSSDNILLSAENVQTMIDNAENGDTITLPSGTAVWVSTVSVPDDKEITIQGSGNQSTIIGSELIIDYTYVILR